MWDGRSRPWCRVAETPSLLALSTAAAGRRDAGSSPRLQDGGGELLPTAPAVSGAPRPPGTVGPVPGTWWHCLVSFPPTAGPSLLNLPAQGRL